jgi:hypothetical protein
MMLEFKFIYEFLIVFQGLLTQNPGTMAWSSPGPCRAVTENMSLTRILKPKSCKHGSPIPE